jgi:hypothetical protein
VLGALRSCPWPGRSMFARVSILDRSEVPSRRLITPEDAFLGATDPRAGRRKGDQAAISHILILQR